MAIACVYCGASHASADEVRACWRRQTAGDPPTHPTNPAESVDVTARPEPVRSARDIDGAVVWRGPVRMVAGLGRNLVVLPGQDVPEGWKDVPRLRITAELLDEPTEVGGTLQRLADERSSLVFEVDAEIGFRLEHGRRAVEERPPHLLGPRFVLVAERLSHLVLTNAVDLRGGNPSWPVLTAAVALGATAVDDGVGDLALPDDSRVWLDGGPIRTTAPIDGVAVLHRVAVEHGSLGPFGSNERAGADLAPDQLAAVTHVGGAARIIAPAGSGKTRVLTERARHLVRSWRLPPSAICLVAFNKRAQEEMRQRTADVRGLQVRTLNSIALAIVNGTKPFAARPRQLRTIDEGEVRRIIGKLVRFPRRRNADPVAPWIDALSVARLGLRDPGWVEAAYDGEVDGFVDVLPKYRSELARAGALDFDEQVLLAIELLLTDLDVRTSARRACRLLLVDEFQDLTPAHVLLVRLLAGPDGAVFGVGDDDQTIYGYNGADPAWLIDFGELFPGAGDHPLEVNYRCPAGIVSAAGTLLRHNARRVPKTIRAASADGGGWSVAPPGDPVARATAAVSAAIQSGLLPSDVAVLTRVNSLLAPVQVALSAAGIPVATGVGADFIERTAVRAATAWLRLATSTGDLSGDDLAEAIRRPARPLHPTVATWVTEQRSLEGLRRLAARLTTERESERVEAFAADIERLRRAAAAGGTSTDLLETLRDSMGLASTIDSLDASRRGMNRGAQGDDLTAIAELATLQPDPSAFGPWLPGALRVGWVSNGVTLATVHRVKGQEWACVVVHHADADQFPHRLADDVEEERRLFHVALTRASRSALIVCGERPSPFIAELTNEPASPPTVQPVQSRATAAPARPATPGHRLEGSDAALFQALRDLRRHLAAGKPAYTVLSDATLELIATMRPTDLAALGRLRGIGPTKLELYGAALLAAVEASS